MLDMMVLSVVGYTRPLPVTDRQPEVGKHPRVSPLDIARPPGHNGQANALSRSADRYPDANQDAC